MTGKRDPNRITYPLQRRASDGSRIGSAVVLRLPNITYLSAGKWGGEAGARIRAMYDVPQQDADLWQCGVRYPELDEKGAV